MAANTPIRKEINKFIQELREILDAQLYIKF